MVTSSAKVTSLSCKSVSCFSAVSLLIKICNFSEPIFFSCKSRSLLNFCRSIEILSCSALFPALSANSLFFFLISSVSSLRLSKKGIRSACCLTSFPARTKLCSWIAALASLTRAVLASSASAPSCPVKVNRSIFSPGLPYILSRAFPTLSNSVNSFDFTLAISCSIVRRLAVASIALFAFNNSLLCVSNLSFCSASCITASLVNCVSIERIFLRFTSLCLFSDVIEDPIAEIAAAAFSASKVPSANCS